MSRAEEKVKSQVGSLVVNVKCMLQFVSERKAVCCFPTAGKVKGSSHCLIENDIRQFCMGKVQGVLSVVENEVQKSTWYQKLIESG